MSRTHRCPDCPTIVEHDDGLEESYDKDGNYHVTRVSDSELCPSCGRCTKHCREDTHSHMERIDA